MFKAPVSQQGHLYAWGQYLLSTLQNRAILLETHHGTAMLQDHLSQGEGAATPGQAHLYQAKLIPQHAGVQRQKNRLASKGRQQVTQYRLVVAFRCDLRVMEKVAQPSHMGSRSTVTMREVGYPSP